MENSLNLLKVWILDSVRSHKIILSQLQWTSRYNLELHDYVVEATYDGKAFVGRGTDSDEDIAICKAVAEAFERYCVYEFKLKNSNGCSVHFNSDIAKKNAQSELFERDCFLFRFIKCQAFKQINFSFFKPKLSDNVIIQNYLLNSKENIITLSRVVLNGQSNIFGLGISDTIENSLKQSEIEVLRQLAFFEAPANRSKDNYKEILQRKKIDFDFHGDLALTPEHFGQIDFLFDQSRQNVTDTFVNLDPNDTQYAEHDIFLTEDNPFFGIPLFFVKAYNPKAQELFVGDTLTSLNPLRINPFAPEKLNLCYHPFR